MLFNSWLHELRSAFPLGRGHRHHARRGPLRAPTHRLKLEPLEDRRLLAFTAPVDYAVGMTPQAVTTADFNNDGQLDLATANADSTVSVLLGNANGTFQPAQTSAPGPCPLSLAVGDFNADGKLDLATANAGDVSVRLGNGDGAFQAPSNINIGSDPASVAVGDFNADGKLDLGVTSNIYNPGFYGGWYGYYWYPGYYTSSANVLLGDGLGGFSAPNSTFLDYAFHNSALAADVNGDLYDDFVTFNSYGYVTVLLGNSSGFLQGPRFIYTGDYSYAVAARDLDGDGANDLVTANFNGNSVGVLLGDGSGSFNGPDNYAVGGYPSSIVLGDFTHDGNLDVATTSVYSNQVSVLYGGGGGAFSTPVHSPGGAYPWAIAAGDFNGDGWLDTATVNPAGNQHTVSVLINDHLWPSPPPSVRINDVTVTEGNTGTVSANFVVTLSNNPTEPVTVSYTTADGSATTADGDYQSVSGTLTFNPGDPLTQTIPVLLNGDRRGEFNETFVVNITSAEAHVADAQGTATIIDDEPTVTIGDASVTEGNSGTTALSFIVTLSAIYDADVAVSFATEDGTATTGNNDYVATSGMLTFSPGDTSETITVLVNGDLLVEPNENVFVNLSNSASAIISDGQGVGAILNDDATKFYVVDASSDRTFEYGAAGQAVENYPLGYGNNDPRGAASDVSGQRVWVIDNDDYVDVYNAAGARLGFWKAKGLSKPEGIASNGTDIWVVDRGHDRVYRYAGAASRTSGSVSPTSSFSLSSGNRDAKGIETDGTHLWVVNDSSTDKVFKYTLSGALVGSWTISGTNTSPTGITLDPSNPSDVWIVDAGRDQVFQYNAAANRTSGSQSASAVFNLAPGNTNPQGIADPPPQVGQAFSLTQRALIENPPIAVAQSPTRAARAARPGDDTPLILPQRPMVSTASGPRAFGPGEIVSEVVTGNKTKINLFLACDAVFAELEELNNLLDFQRL